MPRRIEGAVAVGTSSPSDPEPAFFILRTPEVRRCHSYDMDLTAELDKLAGLHRDGQLTDGEFAVAKGRLLGADAPAPAPRVLAAPPPPATGTTRKAYKSSRWSSGNVFFPDRLTLADDGIHFRKGALFGSHEEHINYRAVASLRVNNGIFLANIDIETSGGSQPVHVNGLWKSAAREIQTAVQAAQRWVSR